jgi:anti-sigma-K factor RskA
LKPTSSHPERLRDLLSDRAIGEEIGPDGERDLAQLLEQHPEVDPDSYDLAAAAIHLALLAASIEALPMRLRQRLLLLAGSLSRTRLRKARRLASPWLGWAAAAAATLLLIAQYTALSRPLSLADVRSASDSIAGDWAATEDPDGAGVTGSFAWSSQLEAGFMSFEGLPANNPKSSQYQLWIFDAKRPAEYPVDGGVFDSKGAAISVPINAKLHIDEPTLFAITLERPGGVVVSSRERLLVTATPSH